MDGHFYGSIESLIERLFGRKPFIGKKQEKLRLVRRETMAYWGDQLIPIKGKHFNILCKLAEHPREMVRRKALYKLIESPYHQEPLLRQYINSIRKAFPPPYCDPHHPEGVVKTRKNKGYYLDLPPDRVEII